MVSTFSCESRTGMIFKLGKEGILLSSIDSECEDIQQNVYVLERKSAEFSVL